MSYEFLPHQVHHCLFWTRRTFFPKHDHSWRKGNPSQYLHPFSWVLDSLHLKPSHVLDLTGWRALLNCNLVLNYAGSSRRFLRQKLKNGKRISSSELVKRTPVQHSSEWMSYYLRYTTRRKGIALGDSLLQQVTSSPNLSASLRLMIESLTCLFQSPAWLS
jgi:hypothetical protein